jgi:hypothetical protein
VKKFSLGSRHFTWAYAAETTIADAFTIAAGVARGNKSGFDGVERV